MSALPYDDCVVIFAVLIRRREVISANVVLKRLCRATAPTARRNVPKKLLCLMGRYIVMHERESRDTSRRLFHIASLAYMHVDQYDDAITTTITPLGKFFYTFVSPSRATRHARHFSRHAAAPMHNIRELNDIFVLPVPPTLAIYVAAGRRSVNRIERNRRQRASYHMLRRSDDAALPSTCACRLVLSFHQSIYAYRPQNAICRIRAYYRCAKKGHIDVD